MFILHNKFSEEENDFLSSTFGEMSLTFHLLKRIHPYHRTHLFLTWGYMTPPDGENPEDQRLGDRVGGQQD